MTRTMIPDQKIIDEFQLSSEKGLRLLMDKYKEPVYWHIRRLVVSYDDAQDVVQETFIRAYRHFGQYEVGGSLAAWVYRIATHEAFRCLSRKREELLSLETVDPCTGTWIADDYVDYSDLESVRLQQAIHSLPPKQQVVFSLRYYDELRYEEIAEIMDSTVGSAKMNYHLAKEKIIAYMKLQD